MSRKPDSYGRDATSPLHTPLKGWRQVVERTWTESGRHNLSVIAAGCAFYALFAIFPALTALITLFGLTANPVTLEAQFEILALVLPPSAFHMVVDQTRRIVEASACAGPKPRAEPRARAVERDLAYPGRVLGAQRRL